MIITRFAPGAEKLWTGDDPYDTRLIYLFNRILRKAADIKRVVNGITSKHAGCDNRREP
jgi:hypothetical protein